MDLDWSYGFNKGDELGSQRRSTAHRTRAGIGLEKVITRKQAEDLDAVQLLYTIKLLCNRLASRHGTRAEGRLSRTAGEGPYLKKEAGYTSLSLGGEVFLRRRGAATQHPTAKEP